MYQCDATTLQCTYKSQGVSVTQVICSFAARGNLTAGKKASGIEDILAFDIGGNAIAKLHRSILARKTQEKDVLMCLEYGVALNAVLPICPLRAGQSDSIWAASCCAGAHVGPCKTTLTHLKTCLHSHEHTPRSIELHVYCCLCTFHFAW